MRHKITCKAIGTVADINDRDDLAFISDSQDVDAIADSLGLDHDEWGSFFVKVEDGDYSEVYAVEGNVPYLHKTLYRIDREWLP